MNKKGLGRLAGVRVQAIKSSRSFSDVAMERTLKKRAQVYSECC